VFNWNASHLLRVGIEPRSAVVAPSPTRTGPLRTPSHGEDGCSKDASLTDKDGRDRERMLEEDRLVFKTLSEDRQRASTGSLPRPLLAVILSTNPVGYDESPDQLLDWDTLLLCQTTQFYVYVRAERLHELVLTISLQPQALPFDAFSFRILSRASACYSPREDGHKNQAGFVLVQDCLWESSDYSSSRRGTRSNKESGSSLRHWTDPSPIARETETDKIGLEQHELSQYSEPGRFGITTHHSVSLECCTCHFDEASLSRTNGNLFRSYCNHCDGEYCVCFRVRIWNGLILSY